VARHRSLARAVKFVERICRIAGDPNLISRTRRHLRQQGVIAAIRNHDTPALFDWLVEAVSFQGIGDTVADDYIRRHGSVRWHEIAAKFAADPSCPKLTSYWHFEGCGYRKNALTCNQPRHFGSCPLPTHNLRNGRLNQAAYSLFLFARDIADGDLIAWLDVRFATIDPSKSNKSAQLHAALLEPLGQIHGVSDKVLSMVLADLLLGAARRRRLWIEVGAALIAIDTLVHNFLHRTGILARLDAAHPYGPACYEPGGCAEVIDQIAANIDARRFDRTIPATFPRFVQKAIWTFCAENGLDECNGRQIDDRKRCDRKNCPAYRMCERVPLKPRRGKQK
jgi:hypothetical protein